MIRLIWDIPTTSATQKRALNMIQSSLDKHIEAALPWYSKWMSQIEETYWALQEMRDSIGNVEKQQQAVNRFMNAIKTDKQLRIDWLKTLNRFTSWWEDLLAMAASLNWKWFMKGWFWGWIDQAKTIASWVLWWPMLATVSAAASSPKLMAKVANWLWVWQWYVRKIIDKINKNAVAKTWKELIVYWTKWIAWQTWNAGKYITPRDDKEETLVNKTNTNNLSDPFANY